MVLCVCVCVCAEETGQVKNCLGEYSLKFSRPDDECYKILVPTLHVHVNCGNDWKSIEKNPRSGVHI